MTVRLVVHLNGPGLPPFRQNPKARCRDKDPDLFFPARYEGRALDIARAVCRGCPLRAECAEWGIKAEPDHGIWGATTPAERKAEAKRRATRHRLGLQLRAVAA